MDAQIKQQVKNLNAHAQHTAGLLTKRYEVSPAVAHAIKTTAELAAQLNASVEALPPVKPTPAA